MMSAEDTSSRKAFFTKKTFKTDQPPLTEVTDEVSESKKPRYSPNEDPVTQKKSGKLMFCALCEIFEQIEATTKRLIIADILRDFFLHLMTTHPQDLPVVVHLCLSRLGPEYEGLELGVGEALLMKAISQSTGKSVKHIKTEIETRGDIGLVAQNCKSTQSTLFKPAPLTISKLFTVLKEIAQANGANANNRRVEKVQALFTACQGVESKYLFRLLAGKLRIGLAEQSLLIALAQASAQIHPSLSSHETCEVLLKQVYNSIPNYNLIIPALLQFGVWELPRHCQMQPGIPLKPMLAFPTKSITQVLDRFEGVPFTCEYKYDGERAQIHRLADGTVKVFSRNSEDMTPKYPDLVTLIPQVCINSNSTFVLDCEVVAWDVQQQKLLPFQILSTRKRKDVSEDSIKVQVCLFAFDLLYFDGAPLLQTPLESRRDLLRQNFQPIDGKFCFASFHNGTTSEDIQAFLEEAIAHSCEGLMVKTLQGAESFYEPSKRSRNWLKLKKDYLEQGGSGLGDSLDLVVIGGYTGRGKRTGGYGGFLLACYDADTERFQAVCKLGTGFSEADLEAFTTQLKQYQIQTPPTYVQVDDVPRPDVWFEPKVVWEVRAADFSLSPIYAAGRGLVDEGKGVSLRFPRFLRVREDKAPEDATSSEQLAEMYQSQVVVNNSNNNNVNEDEDDYY